MSSEPDDEVAWLLAREQGQPLPPVSDATASRHAELESLISELPATPMDPPPGWEAQMLAALQAAPSDTADRGVATVNDIAAQAARRGRLRWALTTAVGAAAAVLAVVVWMRTTGSGEPAADPRVTFDVTRGPVKRGGSGYSVGDTLAVRAEIEGNDGELRVYDPLGIERGRCFAPAPGPGCSVERVGRRTILTTTLKVEAKGAFRAILFSRPLGSPSAGLKSDLSSAGAAGLNVTRIDPIDFQ